MQDLFAVLSLEPDFRVSEKAVEQAYFAAQRQWHPDRFTAKPAAERTAAVLRSQAINDAYETLKNPLRRAEHLLELQGIFALGEDAKASPQILMEMMELREAIADAAQNGAQLAALVSDIKTRANQNYDQLAAAFDAKDYPRAEQETVRLHYLGKAMEEAASYIYRLKAAHG